MTKFNEIEFAPLRIFNRCVIMFNLNADKGIEASSKYAKSFSKQEQAEMLDMLETVKIYGVDTVRKDIMKNMPLQDEEDDI